MCIYYTLIYHIRYVNWFKCCFVWISHINKSSKSLISTSLPLLSILTLFAPTISFISSRFCFYFQITNKSIEWFQPFIKNDTVKLTWFIQGVTAHLHNLCQGISNIRQSKCTIQYISLPPHPHCETRLEGAWTTLHSVPYFCVIQILDEESVFYFKLLLKQ